MRGLPGSGKSTIAQFLMEGLKFIGRAVICSTDQYFIKDGEYRFDKTRLGSAHTWNRCRVDDCMRDRIDFIIVDNTNTTNDEMKPYELMARDYGYEIQYITVGRFDDESVKTYCDRNKHGVPMESIIRMQERFKL